MNISFKPLALAVGVAGLSTAANLSAQPFTGYYPTLGDAAFVPYYTVQEGWVTGVHIINASAYTQVIKVRLRRAEDSLDILDFNLILSPEDVWTGTLSGDESEMRFVTEDDSCTAPELLDNGDGKTYAPVFGERIAGAQEGYIEVIGMGQADPDQPISRAALHVNGKPVNCNNVRSNFFADAITNFDETAGSNGDSLYMDTEDVLKVSYFIRDSNTGIEFGNDAVHLQLFGFEPMMSHQQYGLENYAAEPVNSLFGWDFPDVRGGTSLNTDRDSIDWVRFQLGANNVINDWSYNPATGAAADWVVTFPGQYAMVDFYQFEAWQAGDEDAEDNWDYREIPVVAAFEVYDREEGSAVPGGLNFSPSPAPDAALLSNEVNVITWGGLDVLRSVFTTPVDPAEAGILSPVGWASLTVTGTDKGLGFAWCDVAAGPINTDECVMTPVVGPVPMIGFVAWERTFSEDSNRNYGRIVEHSFTADFAPPLPPPPPVP